MKVRRAPAARCLHPVNYDMARPFRCAPVAWLLVLASACATPASPTEVPESPAAETAPSNLANSIVKYEVLWPWLGIDSVDASTIRDWMLTHLDRANVYVPAASIPPSPSARSMNNPRSSASIG